MHVSKFMDSFQQVFFIYFWQFLGCQLWAKVIFYSRRPVRPSLLRARCQQPKGREKKRRRGLPRLQLQPRSTLTPSSIRTGSLTRWDWWPQPRPRASLGEQCGMMDGGEGDESGDKMGGFSLEGTECWPWGEEDVVGERGGVKVAAARFPDQGRITLRKRF